MLRASAKKLIDEFLWTPKHSDLVQIVARVPESGSRHNLAGSSYGPDRLVSQPYTVPLKDFEPASLGFLHFGQNLYRNIFSRGPIELLELRIHRWERT